MAITCHTALCSLSELKPRGRIGVHALTQVRARGDCAHIQCTGKEGITPELVNSIAVVLAVHQQAEAGLQNFAVGDATDSYGKFAVNQSVDAKALGILPNQRQTGVGGEVVGECFDNESRSCGAHLLGEHSFTPKALIYQDKSTFI